MGGTPHLRSTLILICMTSESAQDRNVIGTRTVVACRKESSEKSKGFGKVEPPAAPSGTGAGQQKVVLRQDKKWELRAAATEEWEAWTEAQKQAAGVKGDDLYVQVCTSPCALLPLIQQMSHPFRGCAHPLKQGDGSRTAAFPFSRRPEDSVI